MRRLILRFLMVFVAVLFAIPVVATVLLSFCGGEESALQGYIALLFDCFIFYPVFWNTIIYAVVITSMQLLIAIPCAFGFMQADFKGKHALFVFYIILMMMPLQVTILPNFIGLRDMGILYTRTGIILPMAFSPFGAVVLYQYMSNMNGAIIEAARLETNSIVRIILVAVVPQMRICIFATALFVFSECFNMVEQPMLFLKEDRLRTLAAFIANADKYSGNVLFPASVIFMIPVLFAYLFFSDSLEKGLMPGGIE